jgi:hypothetical protein
MTEDERWKQWDEWLETILEDVQTALIYRRIFHEVRAMIDSNPRIQKASSFYDWMAGVYADSGLMAVRRQRGVDERAVSMERLLVDMRKNPQVVSRARFVALYRPDMRDAADREFDRYVGAGAPHVDPKDVQRDLDDLKRRTEELERYGTKRVAHLDETGPKNVPTMGELEAAIDLLGALLRKYMLIVRAISYHEPEWAYDWKAIFREPWIPPDAR